MKNNYKYICLFFVVGILIPFFLQNCISTTEEQNKHIQSDSVLKGLTMEGQNNHVQPDSVASKQLIDSLEVVYFNRTKKIRKNMLSKADIENLPRIEDINTYQDLSPLLKKAVTKGDKKAYFDVIFHTSRESKLATVPYSLYFAIKYNYGEAFSDVYHYYHYYNFHLFQIDRDILMDKKNVDLAYLSIEERDLALWTLLMCWKVGCQNANLSLGKFFEEGLYFPQNKEIAQYLKNTHDGSLKFD